MIKKVLGMVLVLVLCVGLTNADTFKGKVTVNKGLWLQFTTPTSGVVNAGLFWTKKAVDLDGMFFLTDGDEVIPMGWFFTSEKMYETCSFGIPTGGITVYCLIWTYSNACPAWLNVQQTYSDTEIRKSGVLEISEASIDPNSEIGQKIRAKAEELKLRKLFY